MINKPWLIVIVVLIAVFIVITFLKDRDSRGIIQTENTSINPQLEQIKEFWVLYRNATAFRINGEWDKAIEEYKKALVLNPEHEDAIYYLGNMYLELGADQEAEKEWLKLAHLNKESLRAHFQLGKLYLYSESEELASMEKAESEFKRALAINQDFIQSLVYLGEVSLCQRDFDSSLKYYNAVLGSDPRNLKSIVLSGFILWKKGDIPKAQEFYTQAQNLMQMEQITESISQEGDTKMNVSMERQKYHSLIMSYIDDLLKIQGNSLPGDMEVVFNKLDQFLINRSPIQSI